MSVHSDTWLLAVAFYNGARLNKEGRERLFELINSLPTVYEVVSGKAAREAAAKPKKRGAPGQPARPTMGPTPKMPRPVSSLCHPVPYRHACFDDGLGPGCARLRTLQPPVRAAAVLCMLGATA